MALELGPVQILFGTAGAEADQGKSQGGVVVNITDDSSPLLSDQEGTAPEDEVITGTNVSVVIPFAEHDFAKTAFATGQTVFGTNAGVAGESKVGTSLLAQAESLILKKYVDGVASTDPADWITFPAAAPRSEIELTYNAADQRVMQVTFTCFPATVSANWGTASPVDKTVRYYFGDETATS